MGVVDPVDTFRKLLAAIAAGGAAPEKSLVHAAELSHLYEVMASLCRRAGDTECARDLNARRLKIWQHWELKLPGNAFVNGQAAAAQIE